MTDVREMTPNYLVTGQLQPEDVGAIAERGVRTIINLRPDAEGVGQPTSESLAAEARRHGIDYHHIPVVPGQVDESQIERFKGVMGAAAEPVLGFCLTGKRAATLWALHQAETGDVDTILERCAGCGYDLAGLHERLEQRRR